MLRFLGFEHTATYRSPATGELRAGDVCTVSEEEAARILADFPEAFEEVEHERAIAPLERRETKGSETPTQLPPSEPAPRARKTKKRSS